MARVQIVVAYDGDGWSVKHNGGYLGRVRSHSEALAIARTLAEWIEAEGRESAVHVEDGAQTGWRPSPAESTPNRHPG